MKIESSELHSACASLFVAVVFCWCQRQWLSLPHAPSFGSTKQVLLRVEFGISATERAPAGVRLSGLGLRSRAAGCSPGFAASRLLDREGKVGFEREGVGLSTGGAFVPKLGIR